MEKKYGRQEKKMVQRGKNKRGEKSLGLQEATKI